MQRLISHSLKYKCFIPINRFSSCPKLLTNEQTDKCSSQLTKQDISDIKYSIVTSVGLILTNCSNNGLGVMIGIGAIFLSFRYV